MAYGLAWCVLAAYLTYLRTALNKSRRHLDELQARSPKERSLVEERA